MPRPLIIRLRGGNNLLAADKGGTSDPYATISLLAPGSGSVIKSEAGKTKTVKKTIAPVWDYTVTFGEKHDLMVAPELLPSLQIKVFDSDTFSSEVLGCVVIPLSEVNDVLEPKMFTRPLQPCDGMKSTDQSLGTIDVVLNFATPPPPSSAPVETPLPDTPLLIPPTHDSAAPPNTLHILLLAAHDLPAMDSAGMFKKGPGTSDPVTTIKVGDTAVKSTVKKKELNPVWNEQFKIKHTNPGAVITLTVDDYDMGSGNDFMGSVVIPVKSFSDGKEARIWHPLCDVSGKEGGLGEVCLAIKWLHDPELLPPVTTTPTTDGTEVVVQPVSEADCDLMNSNQPPLVAEDVLVDGKEPNELHVLVIKGCNVKVMDSKGLLGSLPSISLPSFGKKKEKAAPPSKKEGTSDPFVTVSTTTSTKVTYKTDTIKKTLDPTYTSNNYFQIPESDPGATVTLTMSDADLITTEFMGKVTVPMRTLTKRSETRAWLPLTNKDGNIDEDRGLLLVSLRWVYNPTILSEAEALDDTDMGPPLEIPYDKVVNPANRVTVYVVRARKLLVMDKNMFSSGGSSDPVITLQYDDEKKSTKTIKKSLNPVFMEQFYFDRVVAMTSKNTLILTVEDHDLNGNDFMGRVEISLTSLASRKERREWFPLMSKTNTADGVDRGSLLLGVVWSYNVAAKPPNESSSLDELNAAPVVARRVTRPVMLKKKVKSTKMKLKAPKPILLGTYGNWQEFESPDEEGEIYYYNFVTKNSTWDVPIFVYVEKVRLTTALVKQYTEKSLIECDDSAYHTFRMLVLEERNKAQAYLAQIAQTEVHRENMERFFLFMCNADLKEVEGAFRPWKNMVKLQAVHEEQSAVVEIQRVVRSFIVRRRGVQTEWGMQIHYIRLRVRKFSLAHRVKEENIAAGDGFPLVGEMAMAAAEEEIVDVFYNEMEAICVDEIMTELAVYRLEEERSRKENALNDALEDAFESEDEADEENWETVTVEKEVENEFGEKEIKVEEVKQRKPKERRQTAMEMAIARRKQVELVERGLADPSTLRRALNDQDIALAAEKIEDNIVTDALDGVIEEVEMYLNAAFGLEPKYREVVWQECIRLWLDDPELVCLDVDRKKIEDRKAAARKEEERKESRRNCTGEEEEEEEVGGEESDDSADTRDEGEGRGSDSDDDGDIEEFDIGFGDEGMRAISDAMRDNTQLKKLVVKNQGVGDPGVDHFCQVMKESRNDSLKEVVLGRNHICNVGALSLAKWLVVNDTCLVVDLRNNLIGDAGTRKLMLALRKNERVLERKLRMKGNRVKVGQTFLKRELKLKLGFSKVRTRLPRGLIDVKMINFE